MKDLLNTLKQMFELGYEFKRHWGNYHPPECIVNDTFFALREEENIFAKYYLPNILDLENEIIDMCNFKNGNLFIITRDEDEWEYYLQTKTLTLTQHKDRLTACCLMWCEVKKVNSQERVTDHCSSCKNIKEGFKKLKKVTDNLDTKSKVDPKKLDKPMEL